MSIDVEAVEPHIALITINRPEKRNALDGEHMAALGDAWRRVRDDADVWCAVVTGAGDRAFCAGGDLGSHLPKFLTSFYNVGADNQLPRVLPASAKHNVRPRKIKRLPYLHRPHIHFIPSPLQTLFEN